MNKLIKIIVLFLVLSALRYPLNASYASVPHLLNYQGRLTDSAGAPLNGSYQITFRIYDAESGGNLLWEEAQSVVISQGVFAVLLGSVVNLNLAFDIPYFLEIKVGSEVMSPRQRITSSGYAINAENGIPKGGIIMWSGLVANIPSGWALCDGANGTPNLSDKFIKGIPNSTTNPGVIGGTSIHTHDAGGYTLPNHSHTVPLSGHSTYSYGPAGVIGGSIPGHEHQITSTITTSGSGTGAVIGTSANTNSLPPYYELAFIIKL